MFGQHRGFRGHGWQSAFAARYRTVLSSFAAGRMVWKARRPGSSLFQGTEGYQYVTTPHPVANLSRQGVRDRAAAAVPRSWRC